MPRTLLERPSWAHRNQDPQDLNVVVSLDRVRARREAGLLGPRTRKACLHERHVGTCPACQRAQLARWDSQLTAVGN
ncbi:MAG: hypothetical protein QOH87_1635 [Trebonia sp.]|jgi:hypothetical protein|nr:hypothetical protein [Trebonia sp.]